MNPHVLRTFAVCRLLAVGGGAAGCGRDDEAAGAQPAASAAATREPAAEPAGLQQSRLIHAMEQGLEYGELFLAFEKLLRCRDAHSATVVS